jgi:uncharacterized protein
VTRWHALIAAVLAAAMAPGCGNSPNPRFYALDAAVPGEPGSSAAFSVAVGPVSLPDVVDRPQLVLNVSANRVEIDEFHRWAGGLRGEIARVVAENLSRLLGTARVWPSQNAPGDTDYRVSLDLQRFESAPASAVTVEVLWTVRRASDRESRSGRSLVREPVGADGIDGVAAAHSRALAAMSRDIADTVRALAAERR